MIGELILVLGIIVFVMLFLVGYWISTYNFFKTTKEAISTQWSNIITEYERRVDLFLNLAKSVKSFKKHEKETLVELTKARSGLSGNGSIKNKSAQIGLIDNLMSGLKISVEAYPELKSDKHYTKLMEETVECEDRINAARTGLNEVVREYNSYVVSFPSSIIASHHLIQKEKYYETKRQDVNSKAPELDI